MPTLTELRARREALAARRSSGVARVSYDGKTVEYRSLTSLPENPNLHMPGARRQGISTPFATQPRRLKSIESGVPISLLRFLPPEQRISRLVNPSPVQNPRASL